jgi:hypothetical protein
MRWEGGRAVVAAVKGKGGGGVGGGVRWREEMSDTGGAPPTTDINGGEKVQGEVEKSRAERGECRTPGEVLYV